jgi:ribose transport system permease protein
MNRLFQGSTLKNVKISIPAYGVLLVLLVVTSLLSPTFRTTDNFTNIISQVAPLAIVAIGQTIVLLLGGIDLSVGSVVSVATIIMALYSDKGAFGLPGSILLCEVRPLYLCNRRRADV